MLDQVLAFDLAVNPKLANSWSINAGTLSSVSGTNNEIISSTNKCLRSRPEFSAVGASFTTQPLASLGSETRTRKRSSKRRPQSDIELAASMGSAFSSEESESDNTTERATCLVNAHGLPNEKDPTLLISFKNHQRLLLQVPPRVVVDERILPLTSHKVYEGRDFIVQFQHAQEIVNQLQYHFLPTRPFFNLRKNRPIKSILTTGKEIISESLPIRCLEATFVGMYLTQHMASSGVGAQCPLAHSAYFGETCDQTTCDNTKAQSVMPQPIPPPPQNPTQTDSAEGFVIGGRTKLGNNNAAKPSSKPSQPNLPTITHGPSKNHDSSHAPMRFPLAFKSICKGKVYRHIVLVYFCFVESPEIRNAQSAEAPSKKVSSISAYINSAPQCRESAFGNFGAIGISRRSTLMDKPCVYPSLVSLVLEYEKQYALIGHRLASVKVGLPISYDKSHVHIVPCWRFITVKLPLLLAADMPDSPSTKRPEMPKYTPPTHTCPAGYLSLKEKERCETVKFKRFSSNSSLVDQRRPSRAASEGSINADTSNQTSDLPGAHSSLNSLSVVAYNTNYLPEDLTSAGRTLMCLQGMLCALGNQYFNGESSEFEPPPVALAPNISCAFGYPQPTSASAPLSPSSGTKPDLLALSPSKFAQATSPSATPQKEPKNASPNDPVSPIQGSSPSLSPNTIEDEADDDSDTEMNRRRNMCLLFGRSPLHPDGKYTPVTYASLGPSILGASSAAPTSPQGRYSEVGGRHSPFVFGHKPPTSTSGRLELSSRIALSSQTAAANAIAKRARQIKLSNSAAAAATKDRQAKSPPRETPR